MKSARSKPSLFPKMAWIASLVLLSLVFLEMRSLESVEARHQELPPVESKPIDMESELTYMLKALSANSSRQISFAFPNRTPIPKNDISLVTHLTVSKLDLLLYQIEVWGGPVSCAIYLQNTSDVSKLVSFVKRNQAMLTKTSIHVRLERDKLDYPVNFLRNLALRHSQSDYILTLDADFIPDKLAYSHLKLATQDVIVHKKLLDKTVLVLPAFERLMPCELPNATEIDNHTISKSMMPTSRDELLPMIARGEAKVFHDWFFLGHGSTNYPEWYREGDEFSYPIQYKLWFEPYILAYRHGLPQYREEFRGWFADKISWCAELHFFGYKYEVVRNNFVIHKNHAEKHVRQADQKMAQRWFDFKTYLHETYNIPTTELRDWADKRFGDEAWLRFMGYD